MANLPYEEIDLQRRKLTIGLGAGIGAASLPVPHVWAQGSDAPEKSVVKVSFLPVTDCASLVMAAVLDTGKKYGIKIELLKDTGPATQRDKLLSGEVDAGHALQGQFQGVHVGIGGVQRDMAILMNLCYNGQGITIANQLKEKGVSDGASFAKLVTREKREYTVAQTFPTGCHAMWINYWLGMHGISPLVDVKNISIPGPQMVANMRVGNMDVFCAGEPLSARAIYDKIGFTVATSQAIWPDHPEKVLVCTAEFANNYPKTARALVAAVLDASKYIDAEANRMKTIEVVAEKSYVNNPVDAMAPRFMGDYDDGNGRKWKDRNRMTFFGDGSVTYPYVSDTLWFLTQHRRWRILTDDKIDILAAAKKVVRSDIYADGARMSKVSVPRTDNRKATLADGVVWDPVNYQGYAASFKVKA